MAFVFSNAIPYLTRQYLRHGPSQALYNPVEPALCISLSLTWRDGSLFYLDCHLWQLLVLFILLNIAYDVQSLIMISANSGKCSSLAQYSGANTLMISLALLILVSSAF